MKLVLDKFNSYVIVAAVQTNAVYRKQLDMSNKWITPKNRKRIETRDEMTCCYCGKTCVKYVDRVNELDYATLDHIVPRSEIYDTCGTLQEYNTAIQNPINLVLVCNACNSSKQDTPLYVWCAIKSIEYAIVIAEIARRIAIGV